MASSTNPQRRRILLSTGPAPFNYRIVDVVFAHAVMDAPAFKKLDAADLMRAASDQLERAAAAVGANGVLWIHYETWTSPVGAEVFASGTAVILS